MCDQTFAAPPEVELRPEEERQAQPHAERASETCTHQNKGVVLSLVQAQLCVLAQNHHRYPDSVEIRISMCEEVRRYHRL